MKADKHRYPDHPVIVVDDEAFVLQSVCAFLASQGITNTRRCANASELFDAMDGERDAAAILLDLMMPDASGTELVREVRERYPEVPLIVVTGAADVETAVECMKAGVFDYLTKAIDEARLLSAVTRALEWHELSTENARLRDRMVARELRAPEAFSDMVFSDQKTLSTLLYAESIAVGTHTILITGDTGVGKELVARAIHRASGRSGEFVPVNVAGYDDTMFSDALFGHIAGAYTGASGSRTGLVGRAKGGTLLLDEIGDLPLQSQVKLLRLLESREYYPLGSDTLRRTDARILVSTNVALPDAIESGRFRKDLYYRLETHRVHIPSLRERKDDIAPLIRHFLPMANSEYNKHIEATSEEAMDAFEAYDYPGNVRELRTLLFNAAGHDSDSLIDVDDLPERIVSADARPTEATNRTFGLSLEDGEFPTLKEATAHLIRAALDRTNGNQAQAAHLLGISAPALSRRLSRSENRNDP